ncbi:preprotein translocase subunit SecE [Candidatus Sumerlaeota bacterium]|nr:preprotein translocase subunit SecE [Candidatus Sumerlaeota bacterium]MBI3736361.1 preprotein translocase subunit SecE [Candidatus Sumerlaeota bacterium]
MNYLLLLILALITVLVVGTIAANYKKILVFLGATRTFYYEVLVEMRKVSWPSKDEVISSTIIVGIATVVLTLLIGGVDRILSAILRMIISD